MWQILLAKLTKKIYLEGSISSIKQPQVVILQNWNLKGLQMTQTLGVIMQFSLYLKIV